jgi:hypothetical protein
MTSAQVVIQTGEDGVVLPKRFQRFKQWRACIVSTYFLGVKVFGDKAIKMPVAVILLGGTRVPLDECASNKGKARKDPPIP